MRKVSFQKPLADPILTRWGWNDGSSCSLLVVLGFFMSLVGIYGEGRRTSTPQIIVTYSSGGRGDQYLSKDVEIELNQAKSFKVNLK